jgi:1-acyl-sn-glycerol-3-phosphate acyltransferase
MARITLPTAADGLLARKRKPEVYDARLFAWADRIKEIADIHLTVEGREYLSADDTFVIMSNHQSHFDVPVLYHCLRRRIRMVGKAELFRIPIFGGAMRVAGFVEVDRNNRAQAVAALHGAEQALATGTNIWIAPEGTRSATGQLAPFKKGGFHLALGARARILPVSIDGTKDVLPAHSKYITPGQNVRVAISQPIDSKDYGAERLADLMAAVRSAIAQHIPYA